EAGEAELFFQWGAMATVSPGSRRPFPSDVARSVGSASSAVPVETHAPEEEIVGDASSVAEQPAPLTTVTPRVTEPELPAVNAIERVPLPPVIVPFPIVQAYVAPAPASGTEAALPAEPEQTWAGAVIVASGALQQVPV